MPHVVVVGAGIAGLAAAYEIGLCAPEITVTVVEGADRIGGKLHIGAVGDVLVDSGAEAMLARAPEGVALVRAVGLGDKLVHSGPATASLVIGGAFRPIPAGTLMGVPGDPEAVRAAGVLTEGALARLAAEADAPGGTVNDDVSLGALAGERLGREVVDRLVDPLLGGVYAGRADVLSLQATLPQLAARLRGQGSLVTAAREALAAVPLREGPVFATVRGGLGSLPEAVLRASGAALRLRLPIRAVRRTGHGFRLVGGPVPAPTVLEADAVVIAAPAAMAAGMLAEVAPRAAHELSGVEYASTALVTLVYPRADLPAGSGALVPAVEGHAVKALTFSSQKWPHLAGGPVVVRASVGRHGEEQLLHRDDEDLADLVAGEISALTGAPRRPAAVRVSRWGGALPQYAVGHLDRVRRIRADVASVPGLAVCGAVYEGVGVPACIRTGQQAADRVLAHLGGEGQSAHG